MIVVRRIIIYLKELFEILFFCIRLSLKTSLKYFLLSNGINLISMITPFISIYLGSKIINVIVSSLTNSTLREEAVKKLILYSILTLSAALLNRAADNIKQYFDGMHREIMNRNIKYIIMEKVAVLDLAFFDSNEFYNELADVNNNSLLITMTALQTIDLLKNFAQLIIAFVYFSHYSIWLALIVLISIVPNVIFQKKQLEEMYYIQRRYKSEERKMNYIASLPLGRPFIKDIQLYNLFPFIKEKYASVWSLLFNKKKKISFRYTILLISSAFMPEVTTAGITLNLGWKVINGTVAMGTLTYYQGIMGQLMAGMYSAVYGYSQIMDGKMRIQNYLKFLKWENKVKDDGKIEFIDNKFKMQFDHVSFRYCDNSPFILKNISFEIDSQQKTALVGINGCGKSTLIKLIMRYYDPWEGNIYLNGINLKEYTLDSLRKCFSTLFQDYNNYAFNVRESVSLSGYQYSTDVNRINKALALSGASAFVSKFPNGIDTYLTRQYEDDGEELSGGQWQKIAVARTMFREPIIFILDEPSASLDAESEDELFKQFETMFNNKGVILVSHRLSNISSVDKIIVLKNGEVSEMGTHHELMKNKGEYSRLYILQASKYNME